MRAGVTTPASTWSPIAVDPFTVCFESLPQHPRQRAAGGDGRTGAVKSLCCTPLVVNAPCRHDMLRRGPQVGPLKRRARWTGWHGTRGSCRQTEQLQAKRTRDPTYIASVPPSDTLQQGGKPAAATITCLGFRV